MTSALHLAYKREMKIIRCLIQMNGILLHLAYKREMKSCPLLGDGLVERLHLAYKREMKEQNTCPLSFVVVPHSLCILML